MRTWGVPCPDGKKALGGGVANAATSNSKGYLQVAETAPSGAGTGWLATVYNREPVGGATVSNYVWVICANVTS